MINNGGPAFPFYYEQGKLPDGTWNQTGDFQHGMTLRQWYAGMAIQGFILAYEKDPIMIKEDIAERSFLIADAMIAHEDAEKLKKGD